MDLVLKMLIRVIYFDKRAGLATQRDLGQLIESGAIAAFRRVDKWVIIGKDPIRKGCLEYSGEERRSMNNENQDLQVKHFTSAHSTYSSETTP